MSSEGRYRQRLSRFAENWRAMALRGLVAVLFGLVVLFWPGLIVAVLSLFFGIYALVDGGVVLVPALTAPFIIAAPGCGSRSERRTPARLGCSRLPLLGPSPPRGPPWFARRSS